MILYGLEAAQDLTTTLRDLRRTVRLMQSGLVILFPDEVSGLQLLYSTLDRDLMQVERTCQFITLQLLTALAETPEDIVQLAAFSSPASRGVWINRLYLVPTGPGSLTDGSGRYPVPLDAHPFRVVVRTVQITDGQPGWLHRCTGISSLPFSPGGSNFCAPTSESAIEYKYLDWSCWRKWYFYATGVPRHSDRGGGQRASTICTHSDSYTGPAYWIGEWLHQWVAIPRVVLL